MDGYLLEVQIYFFKKIDIQMPNNSWKIDFSVTNMLLIEILYCWQISDSFIVRDKMYEEYIQ